MTPQADIDRLHREANELDAEGKHDEANVKRATAWRWADNNQREADEAASILPMDYRSVALREHRAKLAEAAREEERK